MLWRDITLEAVPNSVELPKLENWLGVVLGRALVTHKPPAPAAVMSPPKKCPLGKALLTAR